MRILVVEDERDMNHLIQKVLKKSGYTVDGCYDGGEAMDFLEGAQYDGVLLDGMLPGRDGFDILADMRARGMDTPVLLLTARDSVEHRVQGLDLGADDYLVKPFAFEELLARIRAMTRKGAGRRSNRFQVGDLTLDADTRQVARAGREIPLLPKEYAILERLIRRPGTVVTRRQMEESIWSFEDSPASNSVDVYISKLRRKIDGEGRPRLLHTVRGVGWSLREPGEEEESHLGQD